MLKPPQRFVERVNARDVESLTALLDDDFRMIESDGGWIEGRENCIDALARLFEIEPDYRIHVQSMGRAGDNVLISGHATASDPRFAATTLWRARSSGGRLQEWQSYSHIHGLAITRILAGDKAKLGPFLEDLH